VRDAPWDAQATRLAQTPGLIPAPGPQPALAARIETDAAK
jgi:hypothetical protein